MNLKAQSCRMLRRSRISNHMHVPVTQGFVLRLSQQGYFHSCSRNLSAESKGVPLQAHYIKEYKATFNSPKPTLLLTRQIPFNRIGQNVTAMGFLGKRKDLADSLCFVSLTGGSGPEKIQILSRRDLSESSNLAHAALKNIRENSAVVITGTLRRKQQSKAEIAANDVVQPENGSIIISQLEIHLENIQCLNSFPNDIILGPARKYGPDSRHLQFRLEPRHMERLKFRSQVAAAAREELRDFQEIETPILFKSTPEGAREFLVPTRKAGFAYALPQSPQQYKQLLMASGVDRYMQFARCFRDEDLRADRQPEFTQIDLEMAWTDGEGVMERVESFIKALYKSLATPSSLFRSTIPDTKFRRMTYNMAMSEHGSDKPDLRIKFLIHRIDSIVPSDLCGMLTSIKHPIIEACRFKLGASPKEAQKFIRKFMDSPDGEAFRNNADGPLGIFVYDSRRPLDGLQAFGFENSEKLKVMYEANDEAFEDGDLLVVQARKNLPHSGGSTCLGKLRLAIHKAALADSLIESDNSHQYLWVTDFPMFTLLDELSDPGQGGTAGFSATHHPFTAPKTATDVDLLLTDPLLAKADHYDLVVNGIELGGGSRRIHSADMQAFVMRNILKMSETRIEEFSHLLKALRAGCPPHAGLALGFDRLVAVLLGRESVKDVIAFPKSSKGEDPMVKSPSLMTNEQRATYHFEKSLVKKSENSPAQ